MWWSGTAGTTILPWSGQPTDCPRGRICPTAARYTKPFNCGYLKSKNEPKDTSNGFWKDFWNSAASGLR